MFNRLLNNKIGIISVSFILFVTLMGIFAPYITPHDPLYTDVMQSFNSPSITYPLGTDYLGRCLFSRLIYGIRTTFFLAILSMVGTISFGLILGLIAGYCGGIIDEIIMRLVDIMLSFPSQIMILAAVAVFGTDIHVIIIASIFVKWAWYARMIRSSVIKYSQNNYIIYAKSIGHSTPYILTYHILPSIASEVAVLASLDTGWAILNISTLSFLGLGVQAPTSEWGSMLSDARNVMNSHPTQMLVPGVAIMLLVSCFNILGDCLRDILDPKEVNL